MDGVAWQAFFFWLFALLTCGASLGVVCSGNVVRMAVYLILALSGSSGLFFLAGAEFVGTMQLMIYVGGTLVLLIFGVMLTARGPFVNLRARGADWLMAVGVGALVLAGVLLPAAFSVAAWQAPVATAKQLPAVQLIVPATEIGAALVGVRPDALRPDAQPTLQPGLVGYLLPFELISFYLLVVLIGAAYMARPKAKRADLPAQAGRLHAPSPVVSETHT